jgi:hypothetical protein
VSVRVLNSSGPHLRKYVIKKYKLYFNILPYSLKS